MAEPIFPVVPGYSFASTIEYSTAIVTYGGGRELPNRNWAYPLHSCDASAVRSARAIEVFSEFFHAMAGEYGRFQFRDYADYRSCPVDAEISDLDQVIGTGDGATVRFALIKTYRADAVTQVRPIVRPDLDTLVVAVAGMATTAFSFDLATGDVVFDSAPGVGEVISAGYEFYLYCRFGTDKLQRVIEDLEVLSVSAPILEVRL